MKTPLPRLLLVEDDPVNATFLRDAALALPAHVDIAGSMSAALASAVEAASARRTRAIRDLRKRGRG